MNLIVSSCNKNKYRYAEGMVWHTSYHITYESDRDLSDSILAVFDRVDASLNVFSPKSLVSLLNESDSVEADQFLLDVYTCSRRINSITSGAFDPTLSPLIDAWGFGKGHKATADTARIDSIMKHVGIEKTRLRDNVIVKADKDIRFNFSAIAKGYGCDCVAEMMKRNGVDNFLVEIGGEIICAGMSPSGEKWRVSIDAPELERDGVSHLSAIILSVADVGIATSGNYRNFQESGGAVYGHTISRLTGRPVQTDIVSATVIAPTAMEADALATSLMTMPSQDVISLCERNSIAAMLILSDNTILQSKLFYKNIIK